MPGGGPVVSGRLVAVARTKRSQDHAPRLIERTAPRDGGQVEGSVRDDADQVRAYVHMVERKGVYMLTLEVIVKGETVFRRFVKVRP
mgnify:CR=1 FL=1